MPNPYQTLGNAPITDDTDYLTEEIQFDIDSNMRTIAIPTEGVVIGVQGDKNVNRVNFRMPAWYNGFDMSTFQPRINFVDPEANVNYYTVTDMKIYDPEGNEVTDTPTTEDIIYFTWLVDSYATNYVGTVVFNVRFTKFNPTTHALTQAFNTTKAACQVLEGITLADEITQEQQEDLLFHMTAELQDVTDSLKQDIEAKGQEVLDSIPDNIEDIQADVNSVTLDVNTSAKSECTFISGGYIDKNGVYRGGSGWSTTDFVDLHNVCKIDYKLFQFNGGQDSDIVALISYYDANKAFISSVYNVKTFSDQQFNQGVVEGYTTSIPANARYAKFSNGDTFNDSPYARIVYSLKDAMSDVNDNNNTVAAIRNDFNESNKVTVTFPNTGYVDKNGTYHSGSGWESSDYVDLSGVNKISYKLYQFVGSQDSEIIGFITYYDINKVFISSVYETTEFESSGGINQGIVEDSTTNIPVNARYARFTNKTAENSNKYCTLTLSVNKVKNDINVLSRTPVTFIPGGYVDKNGVYRSGSGWSATDFIDVGGISKVEYSLYQFIGSQDSDVAGLICCYDANKQFIDSVYNLDTFNTQFNMGVVTGEYTNFPKGTKYIRLTNNDTYNTSKYAYCIETLDKVSDNIDSIKYATIPTTFPNVGYISHYNNTYNYVTGNDGSGWRFSDYVNVEGANSIDYKLYQFLNPEYSVELVMIAFYGANGDTISIYKNLANNTSYRGIVEGEINVPANAKYARFTIKEDEGCYALIRYSVIDAVSAMVIDNKNTNNASLLNFAYFNKINVIGDSISQGVGAGVPEDDSYVGILRKMIAVENDGNLNYGFESFSPLSELTTVTSKMVVASNTTGWTRTWNSDVVYGSDEYTTQTTNKPLTFTVNKKFNKMKIAYCDGGVGTLVLKADDTEVGRITTTASSNGSKTAKMSSAFDISNYPAGQTYTITLTSGNVATVSGVELIYDTAYPTFNNYGRAGIPAGTVHGALLSEETDCDLLIYALGTNGITSSDVSNVSAAITASGCKTIVVDLGMKSSLYDKTGQSAYLKQLADAVGATYIPVRPYIPMDDDGYIDPTYLVSDGLHPSELGHRCIAELIAKTIKLSSSSKAVTNKLFDGWGLS